MAALAYLQTPQAAQIHRVLEETTVIIRCFQLLLLLAAEKAPIILLPADLAVVAAALVLTLRDNRVAVHLVKETPVVQAMAAALVV
jgi:hypothetical protein